MLKGLPHNLPSLPAGERIAEYNGKIRKGNASAVSIKLCRKRASKLRKLMARLAREQRNYPRRSDKSQPFDAVSDFFPSSSHGGSLSIL